METKQQETNKKKMRNPVFLIILILLVIAGSWFGVKKYKHAEKTKQHCQQNDTAMIFPEQQERKNSDE